MVSCRNNPAQLMLGLKSVEQTLREDATLVDSDGCVRVCVGEGGPRNDSGRSSY